MGNNEEKKPRRKTRRDQGRKTLSLRDKRGIVLVAEQKATQLDAWLERIATSDLAELQSFAAGVEKDKAAVKAGLTWPINNGQVEGQVTKVKLLKRTMYGKAGFLLLRQRVLHTI